MELTKRQARDLLMELGAVRDSRDDRIRAAYGAGVSKSEIFRWTGISRSTIDRILAGQKSADNPEMISDYGG